MCAFDDDVPVTCCNQDLVFQRMGERQVRPTDYVQFVQFVLCPRSPAAKHVVRFFLNGPLGLVVTGASLLVTSALLVVTSATLLVTMFAY